MTPALIAFRIADDRFPLMDGNGAFRTGGRWNSRGRRVVYAGVGFATAMLEMLAHTRIGRIPAGQQFAEIRIPAHVAVEAVEPKDAPGWDHPDLAASRAIGDAWLDSGRTAVLLVPSLPAMGLERNALLNPLHPDFAAIHVGLPQPVVWDARLFGSR